VFQVTGGSGGIPVEIPLVSSEPPVFLVSRSKM
jgi:hypothetical protein